MNIEHTKQMKGNNKKEMPIRKDNKKRTDKNIT